MSEPVKQGAVSIIIPAYNESETISEVLTKLKPFLDQNKNWDVIVVDDGSVDGTSKLVPSYCHLIRHDVNKGHGAALKTGLQASKGETIVIFDADGQHDPQDIDRLLSIYLTGIDLVVGSRRSLWKQINGRGNTLVSLLASVLSGIHVEDLTSGLRVLSRERRWNLCPIFQTDFVLN